MAGAVGWPEFLGQIDSLKYTLRKELRLYTRTLIIFKRIPRRLYDTHSYDSFFSEVNLYTTKVFNLQLGAEYYPEPQT